MHLDNDKFALHSVDVKDLENAWYRTIPGTNILTKDSHFLFLRDIGGTRDPKQAFDRLMALRESEIVKDGVQDDRRREVRLQQQNDDDTMLIGRQQGHGIHGKGGMMFNRTWRKKNTASINNYSIVCGII